MKKQGPRGPAVILLKGVEHVTLTELAKRTGRHISYLSRLVTQGRLPQGKMNGKIRYLPHKESRVDLLTVPERSTPMDSYLAAVEI